MRWLTIPAVCAALFAQGSGPRPQPEQYEAHGQSKSAALGAEFLIHSFSGHDVTYLAPDYLVVEVALYPPKGLQIDVRPGAFSLRLNGRKAALVPAAPQMVAASLDHPEWRQTPGLQAGAGMGGGGVVLGTGGASPRSGQAPYPGQPQSYPPGAPPGPDEDPKSAGVTRAPRITAEELLIQTALPEGPHRTPVSGFLYFPYRGKAGSLKTVELLFEDAVLKLR